jgi:hypothetical protein
MNLATRTTDDALEAAVYAGALDDALQSIRNCGTWRGTRLAVNGHRETGGVSTIRVRQDLYAVQVINDQAHLMAVPG